MIDAEALSLYSILYKNSPAPYDLIQIICIIHLLVLQFQRINFTFHVCDSW